MSWFRSYVTDLQVHQLQNDIASRDALIQSLQADLDRLRAEKDEEIRKDVNSAEFVIDWKNMDAFSIERMGDVKEAYTVIGYWVVEGGERRVHEWKFYCSVEQHNKLAEEFRGKKK